MLCLFSLQRLCEQDGLNVIWALTPGNLRSDPNLRFVVRPWQLSISPEISCTGRSEWVNNDQSILKAHSTGDQTMWTLYVEIILVGLTQTDSTEHNLYFCGYHFYACLSDGVPVIYVYRIRERQPSKGSIMWPTPSSRDLDWRLSFRSVVTSVWDREYISVYS